MELDDDVKSMAIKAGKKKDRERERKLYSDQQEDRAITSFTVGYREKPSLESVMSELLGWGITPYITDYSACRFYRPFGDEMSPPDMLVRRESSQVINSSEKTDFIGQPYGKSDNATATKIIDEGDLVG